MRLRKQCCGEPGSVLRRGGGGSGVRMMEFAIMRGRWQKKNEDTSTARTGRGPGSAYRAMWVLAIWDGILGHQPARQPEEQPKRQSTHFWNAKCHEMQGLVYVPTIVEYRKIVHKSETRSAPSGFSCPPAPDP